jgi:hypothetical protein
MWGAKEEERLRDLDVGCLILFQVCTVEVSG